MRQTQKPREKLALLKQGHPHHLSDYGDTVGLRDRVFILSSFNCEGHLCNIRLSWQQALRWLKTAYAY